MMQSTNLTIPKAISIYFNADASNELFQTAFHEYSVVKDEGRTYRGAKNILQWRINTRKKFQYTATPFEVTEGENNVVVKAKVIGSFPGSPVSLSYSFSLLDGLIHRLEILG